METTKTHAVHGGTLCYLRHDSVTTGTPMTLSVFTPPGEGPFPVLIWLSGLTCTEDNFTTKAGAYAAAAEHGVIIVAPDTSPRGEGVPDDPAYDLGQGAGFYLNATQAPWAPHYRMQDYVADELPALVEQHFAASAERGIFGHSMGGHGALVTYLRHPGRYRSVSAFSPIVAPTQVPWGERALGAYLGPDREAWKAWDAAELLKTTKQRLPLLIDQGEADEYLVSPLRPDLLKAACETSGHPLQLRIQPGYDHSYYFIATFLADHFSHHAAALA